MNEWILPKYGYNWKRFHVSVQFMKNKVGHLARRSVTSALVKLVNVYPFYRTSLPQNKLLLGAQVAGEAQYQDKLQKMLSVVVFPVSACFWDVECGVVSTWRVTLEWVVILAVWFYPRKRIMYSRFSRPKAPPPPPPPPPLGKVPP